MFLFPSSGFLCGLVYRMKCAGRATVGLQGSARWKRQLVQALKPSGLLFCCSCQLCSRTNSVHYAARPTAEHPTPSMYSLRITYCMQGKAHNHATHHVRTVNSIQGMLLMHILVQPLNCVTKLALTIQQCSCFYTGTHSLLSHVPFAAAQRARPWPLRSTVAA